MKSYGWLHESLAEMAGTFILVFFGTGVVHAAVLTEAQSGLWQVAVVWGAAVGLAIYAVAAISGAHINPAMTIAFALQRGFPVKKIPHFVISQLFGAVLAAAVLHTIFSGPLTAFEQRNGIVRGQPGSERSAMVYGEYFPNPAVAASIGLSPECVSMTTAFLAEAVGTGLLAFMVFALTDRRNQTPKGGQAVLIGLTIAVLISVIAPITQACFNPARDFGPRLVAYVAGWKSIAIPGPRGGFFMVYMLAPVCGAAAGGWLYKALIGMGLTNQTEEKIMQPIRILFVGGFLGAGKTTLLYQAARHLMKSGKQVGLVTNDQAPDLVDTQVLRSQGLNVQEVAGSCFCCNFPGLLKAAESLRDGSEKIDLLLAEPVGSCTDLSATIIQPIKDKYNAEFSVGPLSVLIDPLRVLSVLGNGPETLHPSAAYIYRKQLEEADHIVVNKSDLLDDAGRTRLQTLLRNEFPKTKITFISCKTGFGLDDWLSDVLTETASGRQILDIDYDTYAEGEAVLGWLNARFKLSSKQAADWADFALKYMEAVKQQLQSRHAQIGHIKLFLAAGGNSISANLTSSDGPVLLTKNAGDFTANETEMTFNARVQIDPEELQQMCVEVMTDRFPQISAQPSRVNSLRPGRPQPTYRYANTV
ncbi:MAG: MIP family channel protein [Planctomycetaceae bacterium]|nr:MIP family channel protein [Planctomycetaceae bacterium]